MLSSLALEVVDLHTGYTNREILRGIDLQLFRGELVTVLGHNGAGKSTLLKAIVGHLPVWKGKVRLIDQSITYVPQGNRVFQQLSIAENLEIWSRAYSSTEYKSRITDAVELVANKPDSPIRNKPGSLAGKLSGGEKQLLAIACALTQAPQILLLDEPCLGLSSHLAETLLQEIKRILIEKNIGAIVVEHQLSKILAVADRAYVISRGRVALADEAKSLRDDPAKLRKAIMS